MAEKGSENPRPENDTELAAATEALEAAAPSVPPPAVVESSVGVDMPPTSTPEAPSAPPQSPLAPTDAATEKLEESLSSPSAVSMPQPEEVQLPPVSDTVAPEAEPTSPIGDREITPRPPTPTVQISSLDAEDRPDGPIARPSYVSEDCLLRHISRQAKIVKDSLAERWELEPTISSLSDAYEKLLFCPKVPPKKQENGTCEPEPRVNFYPTFVVPETLATYHIFFQNQKIPLSCRANRTQTDSIMHLYSGDSLPCFPTLQLVSKIFEGLGSEERRATNSLKEQEDNSALVELEGDNPRLAVVKRTLTLTHFAYPAITLPPKVMAAVIGSLIMKQQKPADADAQTLPEAEEPVVSDQDLGRWLGLDMDREPEAAMQALEERRKTMLAVCLVTLQLECLHKFFASPDVIKKLGESLHYAFRHGYIKQACSISNVELTNIISYLGILHENRLGQSTLHSTLKDENRRDYIRDTVFLFLVYTWQSAMGIWQQCLESENVKELEKLLQKSKKALWTGFDELTIAQDLAEIVFPPKLLHTLQTGLPDLTSQSLLHNFRSFILERSGILPAMCNALPTDFIPISYRECPPTLWAYTYLFKLANYLMFHSDIAFDRSAPGLLECYCRCNLCTPHRCLATNPALLSETQVIGTFEIQGPPPENGQPTKAPLRLTAGLWTSAYLRKFVPEDYNAHKIAFYEDQSKKPRVTPSACVITEEKVLAQLHEIKKAREDFLLKKGHGVYLDPQTGEELNGPAPTAARNETSRHAREQQCPSDLGTTDRVAEQAGAAEEEHACPDSHRRSGRHLRGGGRFPTNGRGRRGDAGQRFQRFHGRRRRGGGYDFDTPRPGAIQRTRGGRDSHSGSQTGTGQED
ncbi:100k [Deer mastadenovirus B]|uniref:Shutoff protein n=1 Tax=Deer mastadenovirus B TaxID=2170000 RepID=A0A1Y0B6H4_9ADEN|nr:100k [Deer mastadenovirus B]ART33375.1 100k [Deer mastadenovirus B]